MPATFHALYPVLQAYDVEESISYYVERLGFQLLFRDTGPPARYAGIARDNVTIHLQWHDRTSFNPGRGDALMMRLRISDPDALFAEYRDKQVFHDRTALRDTAWGTREFAFYDLNGHGLTFYRPL